MHARRSEKQANAYRSSKTVSSAPNFIKCHNSASVAAFIVFKNLMEQIENLGFDDGLRKMEWRNYQPEYESLISIKYILANPIRS